MKTVLCYGDSNTHGTGPMPSQDEVVRFDLAERWAGVMRNTLGKGWHVIEEGLPGRTTCHDDPIEGIHKNGRTHLPAVLESHWPIDVFVLMLGTNDLKARFSLTPDDVAQGAGVLLELVTASVPPWCTPPKLVLACPAPIKGVGWLGPMFAGGPEKSRRFPPLFQAMAKRHGGTYFDVAPHVTSCDEDGVHFGLDSHHRLGIALAAELKRILPD